MGTLLTILFMGIFLKLTLDDLKSQSVDQRDLILLNTLGLLLFQNRDGFSWGMIMGLLVGLGWAVHKGWMGSGDLGVLSAMGLILRFDEFVIVLQIAGLVGLLWLLRTKKAADSLPFVPFLGVGLLMVYLIRLRLIFS